MQIVVQGELERQVRCQELLHKLSSSSNDKIVILKTIRNQLIGSKNKKILFSRFGLISMSLFFVIV